MVKYHAKSQAVATKIEKIFIRAYNVSHSHSFALLEKLFLNDNATQ